MQEWKHDVAGQLIRTYHANFIANRALAYAFAVGCVLVAVLIRVGIGLLEVNVSPFVTVFLAVFLASVLGGGGPGALALLLSAASAWVLFIDPIHPFQIGTTASVLNLALFCFFGAAMVLVGGILQAMIVRTDQMLKDAKEADRRLHAALEAGRLGSVSYDLKEDRGRWSPAFATMVGLPVTQTSMDFAEWLAIVHPDDRGLAEAALAETITAQAGTSKSSYRIIRPDGSVRWLELSVHTTRDALGQPIELDGVALDVTEQRQEDERKREIVREMHHRIRNNLAVVQALARQTAREETDVQSFAERLVSRLGALSATHDLLIKDSGRGVSLADLLLTETGPFEVKQDKRIMLEGPDVIVPQSMLIPLTLMFHELTTNSAKYGSLACEDGQLRVTWSTAADADRPQLSVVWSEQGGLTTAVPPRTGFGSGLIRRMVNNALGGEVEFLWQPEGLRCAFAIPLVS